MVLLMCCSLTACSQNSDKKALRRFRKAQRKSLLTEAGGPLDRRGVKRLCYYPFAADYKVIAQITHLPDGEVLDFATSSGQSRAYRAYAYLDFNLNNEAQRLTVYRLAQHQYLPKAYADHLFLPFYDVTNGTATYGGGRYIDLRLSDLAGEELLLDFNRAYNPYCAYADGYSCPVPPLNNRLEVAIEAGACNFAATIDP